MLHVFDPSIDWHRNIFGLLYNRIYKFHQEQSTNPDDIETLTRYVSGLLKGNNALHLLFDYSKNNGITAHAFISVEENPKYGRVVFLNQVQLDKQDKTVNQGILEYMHKLGALAQCPKIMMTTKRDPRAISKVYGFKVEMHVMSMDVMLPEVSSDGSTKEL